MTVKGLKRAERRVSALWHGLCYTYCARNSRNHQTKAYDEKTHTTDTIKYIPTIKDWEGLYSTWFKRLVNALWKSGRVETVEDAVQDAFLKVTGLSENRELQGVPEPKTEMEWYGFLTNRVIRRLRDFADNWQGGGHSADEFLAAA